jgi:hypothetical protein
VFEELEAAGDHQVDDEKQIAFKLPHQPLAKPAQSDNLSAVRQIDRRLKRADQKGTGDPDAFEALIQNARPERVKVEFDVRKFRHYWEFRIEAQPVVRGTRCVNARNTLAVSSARWLHDPVRM